MVTERPKDSAIKRGGSDPWGVFHIQLGEAGCWKFGSTSVWIKRNMKEWFIAIETGKEYLSTAASVTIPIADEDWPSGPEVKFSRFAVSQTSDHVSLWPELSPISVVFSPETPVFVTPGEKVTLYVSTPLWLRIEAGDPPALLDEFPTYRPSDTWFGPNVQEGEHCYAVRMAGRLQLDDVPVRVHRAITPIQIRNRASETLSVEKVRLPVRFLSLYKRADGMMWTQPVVLERDQHGTNVTLRLKEQFAPEEENLELLRAPREDEGSGMVTRAWNWFFQKIKEI